MKTLVNVVNIFKDKKGQRRVGVLDTKTKRVRTSNGQTRALSTYKKLDPNGVGFFETWKRGKKLKEVKK
jgi:hypothetical protein